MDVFWLVGIVFGCREWRRRESDGACVHYNMLNAYIRYNSKEIVKY